jgi:hypothetical protein
MCRGFNSELLMVGGDGHSNLPHMMGGLSPIMDVEEEMDITPGV